ncbi:MAG: hypothetical protein LBG64_03290 [Pseudomonadales bacterium]|jgi:hypothetical protein|nr:hypothetical protein [Pseudomonadales bacterium]
MIGTKKLLYILPDLAYNTELLPGKKDGEFVVHSFHQVNGEFMDKDNLLLENLKKLFEKIEPEEYTLILPDFLFADTIVSIPETTDVKIATYLKDKLLPSLGVSTLTHETKITILMQRQSESKVQFTAFEKELSDTLAEALYGKNIKISGILPLSWTIKSVVSLEPSVSVIQIGTKLYLAEHYVGINQTNSDSLDNVEHIIETITTLKGADPNLQTVYLLTNILTEEKIRSSLAKVLPVQQLTLPGDENLQMPSYVKQIIEAAGQTIADKNFPLPYFSISNKTVKTEVEATPVVVADDLKVETAEVVKEEKEVEVVDTPEVEIEEEDTTITIDSTDVENVTGTIASAATSATIAKGAVIAAETATLTADINSNEETGGLEVDNIKIDRNFLPTDEVSEKTEVKSSPEAIKVSTINTTVDTKLPDADMQTTTTKTEISDGEKTSSETVSVTKVKPKAVPLDKEVEKIDNAPTEEDANLKKFAPDTTDKSTKKEDAQEEKKVDKKEKKDAEHTKSKKKGSMADFFKKLLLFILIFALTIAIGLGVGFGILHFMGANDEEIVVATPTPTPEEVVEPEIEIEVEEEATDSAELEEEEEEIDLAEVRVLIVNATDIAGHAGITRTALVSGGLTAANVSTGNAAGTYTSTDNLVLMPVRNNALIAELEEASGLTLAYATGFDVEADADDYDAVIVLNQ